MIKKAHEAIIEQSLLQFQRVILELNLSDEEMNLVSLDDISGFKVDPEVNPELKDKVLVARNALFELMSKKNDENAEAVEFVKEVGKI